MLRQQRLDSTDYWGGDVPNTGLWNAQGNLENKQNMRADYSFFRWAFSSHAFMPTSVSGAMTTVGPKH